MQTQEYKQQLHQRITERRAQLEAAAKTCSDKPDSEHSRGIATAISQLAMHLGDKWEQVDQVEASRLSAWLDSTRFLVETGVPSVAAVAAPVVAEPAVGPAPAVAVTT